MNLDRPSAKNAIGNDMLKGLRRTIEVMNGDPSVRVVMISSSVPKIFCAGADLKVLYPLHFFYIVFHASFMTTKVQDTSPRIEFMLDQNSRFLYFC